VCGKTKQIETELIGGEESSSSLDASPKKVAHVTNVQKRTFK
jgi:hypothetical protein